MCSRDDAIEIIARLSDKMKMVFPQENLDAIMFGSYARNDYDEGSDIDVMYLVDSSRDSIADKNWQIGEAAAEVLLDRGIVISPVVENRTYYRENADSLPFFRNVEREGIVVNV